MWVSLLMPMGIERAFLCKQILVNETSRADKKSVKWWFTFFFS